MQPRRACGVCSSHSFFSEVQMQLKGFSKIGFLLLLSLLLVNTVLGQEKKPPQAPQPPRQLTLEEKEILEKSHFRPPTGGASFYLEPIAQSRGMYLAHIADDKG